MESAITSQRWLCIGFLTWLLTALPAFSQGASLPADINTIVSTQPMEIEAEGTGVHGQFMVAKEILSADSSGDLVYSITEPPKFGRVGLAGGDDSDVFKNTTSRLGYFAYRPQDDYVGEDSFGYSVKNETSGLVYRNRVVITVKPPPPVELQKFEVSADRERVVNASEVTLTTRPNTQVSQKLPSHEDFMSEADRLSVVGAKVVYLLDDAAKPQNGMARLDRQTGQLTYSPNPGFFGVDHFKYYTTDENNPHLGVENTVTVNVEPVRIKRHIVADRSRSREVDLVFVINNSPSMAAHQSRLAENLSRFRQLFDKRDLDYRIGVLTTDFVNRDSRGGYGPPRYYKEVRSIELDANGHPVLDRRNRPKVISKRVASNGNLVTLPVMPQPWVTRQTPNGIFAELVKVGTNGDSNRTAFTAVYNFVAGYYNKQHTFLRPDATTFVVFFMDEEETRMATWRTFRDGTRQAEWVEDGKLPDLIRQYNLRHPEARQTLDGYINDWVLKPFIIVKGNKRGNIEMHAVVAHGNISHRRAAELTGGTVLDIESDFSAQLAALGDRIADTVAVALEPVQVTATLYKKSFRVLVDGREIPADPENGFSYDERSHSIRFNGDSKKKAFTAKIDITYEEHM